MRALSCAVCLTGTRVEKTFKSTDSAEGADVVDMNLTYLYNDGEFWHFMNNETFEQLSADAKAIGDNAKWLLDQAGVHRDPVERPADRGHPAELR